MELIRFEDGDIAMIRGMGSGHWYTLPGIANPQRSIAISIEITSDLAQEISRGYYTEVVRKFVKSRMRSGDVVIAISILLHGSERTFDVLPDYETNARWNTEVNNWITQTHFTAETSKMLTL